MLGSTSSTLKAQAGHRARRFLALVITLAMLGGCSGGPSSPPPRASPGSTPVQSPTTTPVCSATAGAQPATIAPEPSPTPVLTAPPTATPDPSVRPTPSPKATPRRTAGPTAAPQPTPKPPSTPRPSATPRPTTPPPPAPPSALIRHGSRTGNDVALTFDMGGRVGDALRIVGWLVEHRVHATIFMTGAMADNQNTDAGRQVLALVDAHPDLFTLGNHSYTHRDFRNLTGAQIREELRRTEAATAPYCGQDPHPFFRPPNGGVNAAVLAAVGAAGYRFTVTWDIDTIDWRPVANDPPGPTGDQIVAKVLGNAQGGSIVLMHLGGYKTFEALPRIVAGLEAGGYDLVSLDQLMGTG